MPARPRAHWGSGPPTRSNAPGSCGPDDVARPRRRELRMDVVSVRMSAWPARGRPRGRRWGRPSAAGRELKPVRMEVVALVDDDRVEPGLAVRRNTVSRGAVRIRTLLVTGKLSHSREMASMEGKEIADDRSDRATRRAIKPRWAALRTRDRRS